MYGNDRTDETDQVHITLVKNLSEIPSSPLTQLKKSGNTYDVQFIAPNSPGYYEMSINLLATGWFCLEKHLKN
jgi:hypothetical protein